MVNQVNDSERAVVAVLGATGRTGGATVRHLLARGVAVRALVRKPDAPEPQRLRSAGVEVVRADMDDAGSVREALAGVERLFNVQPAFDARGKHQRELELAQGQVVARAAAAAGVRHVVQLSAGPGRPTGLSHFDVKLEIREAMEAAGLVVSALHPSPFMELMTDPAFAPALATWGAEPRVVGWDTVIPWICVDDIGAVAAARLAGPVPTASTAESLVGDHRTLRECRALLTQHGRAPRGVPLPTWMFRLMVGDELIGMWRWLRTEPVPPVSPGGLRDVTGWIAASATSRPVSARVSAVAI